MIQENIEHLAAQGHLPGANILWGSEGSFAIPGLLLVSLCGAALGALVRWRVRVMSHGSAAAPKPPKVDASGGGVCWWVDWVVAGGRVSG